MVYATTSIPLMVFKQTLIPKPKYLRYFNQGPINVDRPSGVTRFKPSKEDLKARITRYCKPNYSRIMRRSTSMIKENIVPVRFYPEPSMHHPSCTDFSKTRLHSLPLTKSPEHPGTCVAPWRPFLGSFRWKSTKKSETDDNVGKLATPPAGFTFGKQRGLNELRKMLKERSRGRAASPIPYSPAAPATRRAASPIPYTPAAPATRKKI